MGAIIFLILLWISIFQNSIHILHANSPATKCSNGGPDIRYPFQIKLQQPQYEVMVPSGFDLLCKHNLTTIHFPSYGDLVVKSISYDTKRIDLLDPKNCVHQVFLNLDLSLTPFQFYYVLKNYTYLNCSTSLSPPFLEVPCLSGHSHHVYTVDPSFSVPDSCGAVKTVAIPFEYSPYLSGNSLGLGLTWDMPQSERTEARDSHISRNTGKFSFFHSFRNLGIFRNYLSSALWCLDLIIHRRDKT